MVVLREPRFGARMPLLRLDGCFAFSPHRPCSPAPPLRFSLLSFRQAKRVRNRGASVAALACQRPKTPADSSIGRYNDVIPANEALSGSKGRSETRIGVASVAALARKGRKPSRFHRSTLSTMLPPTSRLRRARRRTGRAGSQLGIGRHNAVIPACPESDGSTSIQNPQIIIRPPCDRKLLAPIRRHTLLDSCNNKPVDSKSKKSQGKYYPHPGGISILPCPARQNT